MLAPVQTDGGEIYSIPGKLIQAESGYEFRRSTAFLGAFPNENGAAPNEAAPCHFGKRDVLRLAEHAAENRVDMLGVIAEVEFLADLLFESAARTSASPSNSSRKSLPCSHTFHRIALHEALAVSRDTPAWVSASSTRWLITRPRNLFMFFSMFSG